MTELWFYLSALVVTVMLTAYTAHRHPKRREPLLRTGGTILAVWLLGVAYVNLVQDFTPWKFNLPADACAAFLIMRRPAERIQGYIGLTFCIQVTFHIGYGIRELMGAPSDAVLYYDALTYLALLQLLLLGGWCGGIWRHAFIAGGGVFRSKMAHWSFARHSGPET